MHIVHVAAENDALPGGKVGGIGDVIRDIAPALAARGCEVTTLIPSHGFLNRLSGARLAGRVGFDYYGFPHEAEIFDVPAQMPHQKVRHCVVHHPLLTVPEAAGRRSLYIHDPSDRPFAADADRFAFFSRAVAEAAVGGLFGEVDVFHLHDWHAAFVLILRAFHPAVQALQNIRMVLTVHNLALQGVRPLRGSHASLEAWFPEMHYGWFEVSDPRWPGCVNPLAAGIRLADVVHTVSPTYAAEICHPSDPPRFFGAEGLEAVLRYTHDSGRLIGILNGCPYPEHSAGEKMDFHVLIDTLGGAVVEWAGQQDPLASVHFVANARLQKAARKERPPIILTSVARVVAQKMLLLRAEGQAGGTALERILNILGTQGYYFLLGQGDAEYERFFTQVGACFPNFIFLNGFSNACADALYAEGDLFLMPSSYEPCGIGQMLALREGQPCVVHAVGGLRDTIRDGLNGFTFNGGSVSEQVDAFVETVDKALKQCEKNPEKWCAMQRQAAEARFTWDSTARDYLRRLYRPEEAE